MYEKRMINGNEIEVIPAHSIREEKEFIKMLKCSECGGDFRMNEQSVFPEEKMDRLVIQCKGCKAIKDLYFDISSFWGNG